MSAAPAAKRARLLSEKKSAEVQAEVEEDGDVSHYERNRNARIAANRQLLIDLGLALPAAARRARSLLVREAARDGRGGAGTGEYEGDTQSLGEPEGSDAGAGAGTARLPRRRFGACAVSLAWARAALSRLPLLRSAVTLAFGAALYYVRIVRFSHGYKLQDFANEAHNPLALIRSVPRPSQDA